MAPGGSAADSLHLVMERGVQRPQRLLQDWKDERCCIPVPLERVEGRVYQEETSDACLPTRAQPGGAMTPLGAAERAPGPAPCVCQRPLPAPWAAESSPSPPPLQPPQGLLPAASSTPGGPLLPHLPPAPCFVRKNLLSSSRSHCPHWIPLEVRASGQTAPDPREPGSLKSSCCISAASQPSLALGLFQNETKRACPSSPHKW